MRSDKLSTSVHESEKQDFRMLCASEGKQMGEKLRELVYDELEAQGYETSREGHD